MFEKLKLINYSISIIDNKIFFNPIKSSEIKDFLGFDFYLYEDDNNIVFLQGSNLETNILLDLLTFLKKDFIKNINEIYDFLKEIFQLYIWKKETSTFYTIIDYLGVGSNYVYRNNKSIVFFSNFLKIKELGISLKVTPEGLYNYLAIGYQVSPFKLPYSDIDTHKGAVLYTYKNLKIYAELINPCLKASNDDINIVLSNSIEIGVRNAFIGATGGKDSLALISSIKNKQNTLLGSFGDKRSADVLQGEKIANQLKLNYIYQPYSSSEEFLKYSNDIALISGGLTTTSYADMLCFVDKSIPLDYTYVMGEGGECVRDFFIEKKSIEASLENYITPPDYLEKTLIKSNYKNVFKTKLINKIEETYKGEPLLNFYRYERMPGNFSNRHKVLSMYRTKYSPFLNYNFIKNTYNLNRENFIDSKLHQDIILKNNESLFKWFSSPITSLYSSQNYEERFQEYLGGNILNVLNNMSATSELYFNKRGLIDLLNSQYKRRGREIYYLLRAISFIIFIDSNEGLFVNE